MKKLFLFVIAISFILCPAFAMADSITPETFSAALDVGESVTITKTVTVDMEPPTTAPVDVFFLTDSTGSMYSAISEVQSAASAIMASAAGLGDVNFGCGEYRDEYDIFTYRTNQTITGDTTAVQTGIDAWSASGGGDWAEANLYALNSVATEAGWRDGSTRILVWFGDAPGHDPSVGGVTEAGAIDSLNAANVSVEALDVGSLDSYGQATRIAAATGGHYYGGVNVGNIVDTIGDAIETAVNTYSTVGLDLSSVPTGVSVSVTPGGYTGAYDRSVTRTFDFDVTFTGDTPGAYEFSIAALVDGGAVAWESDSIAVGGGEPVPEPGTIFLMGSGLLGFIGFRKKIKK